MALCAIPGALNSKEKKFHLADLDVNARMRRYENAFLWLSDAMVANIAYNSTDPAVGLEMSLESSLFKCYAADTGLLVTQAMTGSADVDALIERCRGKLGAKYVVCAEDFSEEGGITYLPFYMIYCL